MRPSALLRALSCKSPAAPVAPWPPALTAFDRWLTSELDELRLHPHRYATAAWLSKALDHAAAAQRTAATSVSAALHCPKGISRAALDEYLDDTVELLDACDGLRGTITTIRNYTNSLAAASHCLEGEHEPSGAVIGRARAALDSCEAMEKRCAEPAFPSLRKLAKKLASASVAELPEGGATAELREALSGSRAVALLIVGMLGVALSFKGQRGIPAVGCCSTKPWAGALQELHREAKEEMEKRQRDGAVAMMELDSAVSAARGVRGLIGRWGGEQRAARRGELKPAVEALRRRCGELDERVGRVEEGVDELYRELISIRVSLLGLLSEA